MTALLRGSLTTLGVLCVGLGVLGIVLPLLPTTPLLLAAGWCFARSNPRLERWLLEHPRLGPTLIAWREHRVVPMRAKVAAGLLLTLSVLYALLCPAHALPATVCAVVVAVAAGIMAYLARCPSTVNPSSSLPP